MEGEGGQAGGEGIAEAQGAESGEGQGFVDQYLTTVPEDYRPHVEPYVRDIERNTNSKFQEHAEYRKQWEPWEEIGISDYDPQAVAGLLEFAESVQDEGAFRDWWMKAGQETGLLNELLSQYQTGDDDEDWDDEDDSGFDPELVQQALDQYVDQKLQPFLEQQRTQQELIEWEETNNWIDDRMESLKEEYGEFDEQAVYKFAMAYSDSSDDPIGDGFQDYLNMVANIEQGTLQRKSNQPPAPQVPGPANTNATAPTSFEDAKKLAKERLAQRQ